MKCFQIRVTTRDQFERAVFCPQMNVEVTMSSGAHPSRKTSFAVSGVIAPTQSIIQQVSYANGLIKTISESISTSVTEPRTVYVYLCNASFFGLLL